MALQFGIRSDLCDFGATEDGERYIGEIYYIVAEDKIGCRWANNKIFPGVETIDTEDGGVYYADIREDAISSASKLLRRIETLNLESVVDRQGWHEIEPCFGSQAYETEQFFIDRADRRAA
jgi:hypothetical protein